METNVSLYKKIHAIMCASKGLDKSMKVGTGNNSYNAIGEAAVLNEVKPLLQEHGVIIIPIGCEVSELETHYEDGYGKKKTRLMTQLKTRWKIIDIETGQFEILESPGNGVDTQDKASGKAWTYAYKALLQKTFMLFSGEDTDNHHSDDLGDSVEEKSVITTEELSALAELKGVPVQSLLDRYKKETNKTASELKFMSQEYKQKYYNILAKQ